MESFGLSASTSSNIRRKRSSASRRPRNDSWVIKDNGEMLSFSSSPPSDNIPKLSSDENTGFEASSWKKELGFNQCLTKASTFSISVADNAQRVSKDEAGYYGESKEASLSVPLRAGRCSEGVLAPANWKSVNKIINCPELQSSNNISRRHSSTSNSLQSVIASDGSGTESKLKRVKLKVGGVTRTIHAQSTSDGASVGGRHSSDVSLPQQKLKRQENLDGNCSSPLDKESGLRGVPWKNFSQNTFTVENSVHLVCKAPEENGIGQVNTQEAIRKSKRVPKRRLLDVNYEQDSDDEEIRYLEKLRTSKVSRGYVMECEDEDGGSQKQRKMSRVMKNVDNGCNLEPGNYGLTGSGKECKKTRNTNAFEDADYDEEDSISEIEIGTCRKKPRKELSDFLRDSKKEPAVTTRQRALQTSKDVPLNPNTTLVEFPNGLPPAPPRKQKEKLSDVEQQLKKAEAAQRRRKQMEKAARESEAEAIRKILGQDSSRKKREDKMKKRQEEIAQEKAANAMKLSPKTIRWIMGPTGTVVMFANDLGLPTIFDSKPCRYPAPREKCAGPACLNPYKYRDSKSKLPLCSLQCYKAIREQMQPVAAC